MHLLVSPFLLLFLFHCSPTPRAILDANTPTGALAYLLPLFFPELKPSDSKAIKTFSVLETGSGARVLGRNITLTVPYSTDISSLTSEFFQTGERVTLNGVEQISGQTKNNYSSPLTYTVTARNQTTQNFTVITNKGLSSSNSLLSFSLTKSLGSEFYTGSIIGNSVTVYVPFGTDVSSLVGIFSHNGKKAQVNGIDQVSGKNTQNFSSPVIYTILSEIGTSQSFSVKVEIGTPDSKEIKALWLNSSPASIIGTSLAVTLPFGTNLSDLLITFIQTGSELKIGTKTLTNAESTINAINPVTITVLARDGSTKDYRLRVSLVNEFVTIGGMVSGLGAGLNLSLTNNGTDNLNITSNGTFTFGTALPNGSEYNVSIITQPMGQNCSISGGSGVGHRNINNINVVCSFIFGNVNYTDNRNGTITDNTTGVTWMKCTQGQVWRSAENDCQGTGNSGNNYGAVQFQWCTALGNDCNGGVVANVLGQGGFLNGRTSQAYNSCNQLNTNPVGGFANKTNWRIPTIFELETIIDRTYNPIINPTYFPNSVGGNYWSSTTYLSNTDQTWIVMFGFGVIVGWNKTNNMYVRCVSGP
jgi:hypothetical protein